MATEWYESKPRRWRVTIVAVIAVTLATSLVAVFQLFTRERSQRSMIAPDEQLATEYVTVLGWTVEIQPDGSGFKATASRGEDRLVASGATRDLAAGALARKVAGP